MPTALGFKKITFPQPQTFLFSRSSFSNPGTPIREEREKKKKQMKRIYNILSPNECHWICPPTIPTSFDSGSPEQGCGALGFHGARWTCHSQPEGLSSQIVSLASCKPTVSYTATVSGISPWKAAQRWCILINTVWIVSLKITTPPYSCYSHPQCHHCFLSLILRFRVWHFHSKVRMWTQWLLNHHSGHKDLSNSHRVFFFPCICPPPPPRPLSV